MFVRQCQPEASPGASTGHCTRRAREFDVTPDLSGPPFNGTANPQDVAWSPDGSTIAFTNGAFCGYAGAHLMLIEPGRLEPL